jgi:hypothetical protein
VLTTKVFDFVLIKLKGNPACYLPIFTHQNKARKREREREREREIPSS